MEETAAQVEYDSIVRHLKNGSKGIDSGVHGKPSLEQKRRGKVFMEKMLIKGRKPVGEIPPEIVQEAAWTASHFDATGSYRDGFASDLASADAAWFEKANAAAASIQAIHRGKMARQQTREMVEEKELDRSGSGALRVLSDFEGVMVKVNNASPAKSTAPRRSMGRA